VAHRERDAKHTVLTPDCASCTLTFVEVGRGAATETIGADMKSRRILATMGAALMVAGGASLGAAPATWADQTLTAHCPSDEQVTVHVQPHDVVTVTNGACALIEQPGVGTFYSYANLSGRSEFTILGSVHEGDSTVITYRDGARDLGTRLTLIVDPAPVAATAAVPIPPWVQAYGIFHHDDACLTSWTNSWQKWAEPITGGWVCTRTVPSLG